MRRRILGLAICVALAGVVSANASTEGDTIHGTLYFGELGAKNYFDPANNDPANGRVYVPDPPESSGIQPAAVVSVDDTSNGFVEFTYQDPSWRINVDVDATTVEITQLPVGFSDPANSWDIYLTGLDFNGGPGGITRPVKLATLRKGE